MFHLGKEAAALSREQRLHALYRIIPPSKVKQVLRQTGRGRTFCARLSDLFTVFFVLAMGLFCRDCYRQIFRWLRPWHAGMVPGRSTLCEARRRVGVRPLLVLAQETIQLLATPHTPGAFGRPHGGRADGAFPQVRTVALCEAATHVMWRWLIKPTRVAEQPMADWLLRFLTPDMLLLWDRNFLSYRRVGRIIGQGTPLLARVKTGLIFQPLQRLADGSYLAKLYRNATERKHDRDGIVVRIMDYTFDDPNRPHHGEKHRLLTTLLDAELDPANVLIELYHVRWEEELSIDEIKTHQMERPTLRSQTPAGVVQELYALLLDHFVVRNLMFQAAQEAQVPPVRISFVGTLKILRCRIPQCPRRRQAQSRWWRNLVREAAEEVLPPRRNRTNPRVIKRKMSKWKKKRPQHRLSPQPTRSFAEAIVMIR